MINKRGLSPKEFDELPPELFDYLMIYDALIEPSGTKIDMLYHCYSNYYSTINNPNMTEKVAKTIDMRDYDFLNILGDSSMTREEKRIHDEEQAAAKNNAAMLEWMKKQLNK